MHKKSQEAAAHFDKIDMDEDDDEIFESGKGSCSAEKQFSSMREDGRIKNRNSGIRDEFLEDKKQCKQQPPTVISVRSSSKLNGLLLVGNEAPTVVMRGNQSKNFLGAGSDQQQQHYGNSELLSDSMLFTQHFMQQTH
jgi:hypothetical protein